MIQTLATRHQKKAALFIFFLFYLELVAPNLRTAFAAQNVLPLVLPRKKYMSGGTGTPREKLDIGFTHPRNQKKEEATKVADLPTTIGGPGQSEASGFKSVNSSDMVDLFTGDFSYNIPLLDVGGYPVNIHYNSNVSMDQEASWVGLGWNISPGAINRTMRGLPDDFDGTDSISKLQHIRPNETWGVTAGADVEIKGKQISLGASLGVFNNSYNGFGVETGINASINAGLGGAGGLTAGLSITNNSQTGLNVSPSLGVRLLRMSNEQNGRSVSMGLSTNYNSRTGVSALSLSAEVRNLKRAEAGKNDLATNGGTGHSIGVSFAVPSYTPGISMPYTSTQYSFKGKVGSEKWIFHPSVLSLEGYISKQEIKPEDMHQKIPAAGYLYLSNTSDRPNTLQDFNREKDIAFNPKTTPHIAIPQYTYDIYSFSGEGTGGTFRPFRGDAGFVRDYSNGTKSKSDRFSIDLGFGAFFHGGVDFSFTNAYTRGGGWVSQNMFNQYAKFRRNDTTYQAVYFRNPGEMTSNTRDYYESIGGDALIRVKLVGEKANVSATNAYKKFKNGKEIGEIPVTSAIVKKQRDKRSQVITYLTAQEASQFGLNKQIISYKENTIPVNGCADTMEIIQRVDGSIRKKNHLSEIRVLNTDGRAYVYGIPAYNVAQKDVVFSVDRETNSGNIAKGLVGYAAGTDNSVENDKGKEALFMADSMPAYAHSFLLTGIVSPDYIDVKGDGITDDDLGEAIKFNYTRVYGSNNNYFQWRTPNDSAMATYNEGFKTYSRDDKGTYIFGKKEVWYLNSVESKTMVAVFTLDSNRQDIYSVRSENGGLDKTKPMRKLTRIDLYTKADLIKNGNDARPVKSVHFSYSYSLCKGYAGDPGNGKLTLDSIWFSYNGNEKGRLNPYVFKYHADDASFNPNYHPKKYDRWGNYKDASGNPGGLSNSDYPYAEQSKTLADKYAAMWTLDEIKMPSGGRLKVYYESDDYAFVQDKRAAQFFKVAAVSASLQDTLGKFLYDGKFNSSANEKNYVFVRSDVPLLDKDDIRLKYLDGMQYLYFKLAVKVPSDRWGSGHELVPVYAEIEDYGLVNSQKFWIKLKPVEERSPLARSAIQFLRLNLPSKAFPASEPGKNTSVWEKVKILATSFGEIKAAIAGYDDHARGKRYCREIDTTKSFVRLDNPNHRKLGGGLRVKRIEMWDNWYNMTGQKESVYGQDYSYTKTEKVNGKDMVISSGVASYEPAIGAEENPFRTPIPYSEQLAPMAPANDLFSEHPLGESYYPSASVGYSKVRIRTINTKARSANGWSETEFFTTRDFPVIVENTIVDLDSKRPYKPKISSFLKINTVSYLTVSQGFKVELNDMDGKVKAKYIYAETDSVKPISYVRNFYKVDNDTAHRKHLNNTVWVADSLNGHINTKGLIGKDIEVIHDMREQTSVTLANNKSANLDVIPTGVVFFPFLPLTSLYPLPQKEETRFRSAATVKVIHRYGILDSVVVMDKGSVVSTKNLVYDNETGNVLLSRTNNEFNDPVYNFSYPAHWAYSGMGMAYKNIDAVFTNLKLIKGKLYYGGTSTTVFPSERFFESGDELHLKGWKRNMQPGDSCLQYQLDALILPLFRKQLPLKAWVIDAAKAMENDRGLYFIDEQGRPITGSVDYIRVLRSGKRNILDAGVGGIVSLANPIKEVGTGEFRLVIDSNTQVINTTASTFKDIWQIQNYVFGRDTVYKISHEPSWETINIKANIITKRLDIGGSGNIHEDSYTLNSKNFGTSFEYVPPQSCFPSRRLYTKSIATFDLSTIPSNADIIGASLLYFYDRKPTDLWFRKTITGPTACTTSYSYDWPQASSFLSGTTTAYLKRITSPWNYSTPYSSILTTDNNKVQASWLSGANCFNLLRDALGYGNYGFLLELDKNTPSSATTPETNFINFAADDEYDSTGNLVKNGIYLSVLLDGYRDSVVSYCYNAITDSLVNPYRVGILGNWRPDQSFSFYHDRKESSAASTQTNIRKDGQLKDFAPFWKFTDSGLLADADTSKWVWNNAITVYNKYGYEIESKDPLGRYTAGIYGFNQAVPTAVAQNSEYRELLYDGFEDYSYKTKQCAGCENAKEVDFIKNYSGVSVSDSQSHTGNYSMKVLAGYEGSFTTTTVGTFTQPSQVSLQVDSAAVSTIEVVGTGTGLTGTYTGYTASSCPYYLPIVAADFTEAVIQGPLDFNWGAASPRPGMCNNWYGVHWKGKIQAPFSDNYRFYISSDWTSQVKVNGVSVVDQFTPNSEAAGSWINLQKGQLYDIEVSYSHIAGSNAQVHLSWQQQNQVAKQIVPVQFLYKDGATTADTAGSIVTNIHYYCIAANNAKGEALLRPEFAPRINSLLVAGAWVKLDGDDCNTAPSPDSVVRVELGDGTIIPLEKRGVKIEGWQRYEVVFKLPKDPMNMDIRIVAPSDQTIYVDDVRVQPFNSVMKSFAYDDASLRLMAELDENNYATFYEYDDDGTLIRVKKETVRGIMTVKESRMALGKEN